MPSTIEKKQKVVDENYKAFSDKLPELMKNYAGKFVVLREREVAGCFDTSRDAMIYGTKTYPDGLFSIQEVTQKAIDLGWFSHADLYDTV